MATTIELLQKQIDLISQLRDLPSSEHPKFKEWEQLTNAIIEKRLGKEKSQLLQFLAEQNRSLGR